MHLRLVFALLLCATAVHARPNILFIFTDDQAPDTLSCYGNKVTATPSLDRLAREGLVFDDAHHMGSWTGAVCTASRTMLMTGRTLWRIPGANGPGLSYPKSFRNEAAQESLPAVFNRAGYDTFRTCKIGNSYDEANKLFTVRKDATKRGGTAESGSAWHAEQVLTYLKERKATNDRDPFLIYFGFSHPHDPRTPTDELAAKYGAAEEAPREPNAKSPPLPANWLPAHPFPHGHPKLRDEEDIDSIHKRRDEAAVRNELAREYSCLENIDTQIGRVLAALEANGELDNTYVFFSADHGIAVGRHGLMGKQNLYEHSWRVPLLVRGPGIKPGRTSRYVYLLDVLPTLCDLAGIKIPATVDGQSFRPVLEGKTDRIRDTLYGCYCGGTKPGMRAVKKDGWKLITYDVLDGKVQRTQLFNLRENPHELLKEHQAADVIAATKNTPQPAEIDLADVPEHAAKRRELEQLLRDEMKRLGDPYPFATLPPSQN